MPATIGASIAEVMIVPRCVKGMNRLLVTSRINRRMYAIRARIESFASRTNMSIPLRMQMLPLAGGVLRVVRVSI